MLKRTELKSYTKLSARQVHECAKLLEQHLEQLPEGTHLYRNGMTDSRIGDLLKISGNQVQHVRQNIFGTLKKTRGPNKVNNKTLLSRIEALELWAADRKHTPFKL